jgi:hypothetical protein
MEAIKLDSLEETSRYYRAEDTETDLLSAVGRASLRAAGPRSGAASQSFLSLERIANLA